MKRLLLTLGIIILAATLSYPQGADKKEMNATRSEKKPKIDGVLDEAFWQQAKPAKDFVQYEPFNGAAPTFQTEIRIVYDDQSIYIGAMMYDDDPDKIMLELGPRDSVELNADGILISISPYNDGLNSFDFGLYASGVQVDIKTFSTGEDISWDAVWRSEVKITDNGWIAEIEIPYSALRFPKTDIQLWGLNILREIRRIREQSYWNFVDKKVDGTLNQAGFLTGIEDVRPPLRLSFEPYLSTSVMKEPEDEKWDYKFSGGMDLKYGINESFTLDMTLVPDFSQVPSDDQVVNLSPFETYYSEKRQFFTEGVELFSRGNIFYSRRIGSEPLGYDAIRTEYQQERIMDNPEQAQLINATKLSGRTSKGTGLGLFNAMTLASYATVTDSSGNEQEVLTQPFTNYNMVVADQSLPNKSYISLYNTNVYRGQDEYTANVTGTEMSFRDRKNNFQFNGLANLSQQYYPQDPTDLGFLYQYSLEKISGNTNYGIYQEMVSDTYDPNDLGFLEANNRFENGAWFSYNIFDPVWKILEMESEVSVEYSQLYAPREFTSFEISFENRTQFRNRLTVGLEADLSPVESHDYFEPRNEGWYGKTPPFYNFNAFYSPDYNKTFLVDVMPGIYWGADYGIFGYSLRLGPRYKVNDHLFMELSALYRRSLNDLGYVTDSLQGDDLVIIFGKRDIENITTTFNVNYTINPDFAFSFRVRYYYFEVDYDQYYDLEEDGSLTPDGYEGDEDFIYNAFNIDAYFTWLFAPGSELVLAWKNAIYTDDGLPSDGIFGEFRNTIEAPASNLISLKLLYYLDYQYFKKLKKQIPS
jgi:hypothetical protein